MIHEHVPPPRFTRIPLTSANDSIKSNVYLIGCEPPLLVDCGVNDPVCLEQLKHGVRAAGVELSQIGGVLITHGHPDHTGLAAYVSEEASCPVYIGEGDLDWAFSFPEHYAGEMLKLESEASSGNAPPWMLESLRIEPPRFYSVPKPSNHKGVGELPRIAQGPSALSIPGHTEGSTAYLLGKAAATGDTVLETLTLAISSLSDYLHSLDALEHSGVDTLLPGHGAELEPARKWISSCREKYLGRYASTVAAAREPGDLYDVCRRVYSIPGHANLKPDRVHAMRLLQTKVYLTEAIRRGDVEAVDKAGSPVYRALRRRG